MLAARLRDRLDKAFNDVFKQSDVQDIIAEIKNLSLFKGHALTFKIISAKDAKMQDSIGPAIDDRIVPLIAKLISAIKKHRGGAANFAILVFNTGDEEPWLTIINETGAEVTITQRIAPVVADLSMFKEYFRVEHNAPIQVALSVFTRYLEANDRVIIQINDKQCNFRYVKSNEKAFAPAETTMALKTLGKLLASFTTEEITLSLHHSTTNIIEQYKFNTRLKAVPLTPESPKANGGAGTAVTAVDEAPSVATAMKAIAKEVDALLELVNFLGEIDAKKYSSASFKPVSMDDNLAKTLYELSKCISDLLGNRQIMIDFLSDQSAKLLEAEKAFQPTLSQLNSDKLTLEGELKQAQLELSKAQTKALELELKLKAAQELLKKNADAEAKLKASVRELNLKIDELNTEIAVFKNEIRDLQQKLIEQAKQRRTLSLSKFSGSELDYPPVARTLSTRSFPLSSATESTYDTTLSALSNEAEMARAKVNEVQLQLTAMASELAEAKAARAEAMLAHDALAIELNGVNSTLAAEISELRASMPTAPALVQVGGVTLEDGSWVPTFVFEASVKEARERKAEQDALARQTMGVATSYPAPAYVLAVPMYTAYTTGFPAGYYPAPSSGYST